MKKAKFLALLISMFAALAFVACEADDDADADGGTNTNTTNTTADPDAPTYLEYYFVRIDDQSTDTNGEDPGADIDAVGLVNGDGSRDWLSEAGGQFASTDRDATVSMDFAQAEGEPNAFTNWASNDSAYCSVASANFAALGGTGAYLIGRFGDAIDTGDQIVVYEVGNCDGPGTSGTTTYHADPDAVAVSVSVSNEVTGTWTSVGTGTGGVMTLTVPTLPNVEAD
jgi:hypothetical protein